MDNDTKAPKHAHVRADGKTGQHFPRWDVLTTLWTDDGRRAHPCQFSGCSELYTFGTVRVVQ